MPSMFKWGQERIINPGSVIASLELPLFSTIKLYSIFEPGYNFSPVSLELTIKSYTGGTAISPSTSWLLVGC